MTSRVDVIYLLASINGIFHCSLFWAWSSRRLYHLKSLLLIQSLSEPPQLLHAVGNSPSVNDLFKLDCRDYSFNFFYCLFADSALFLTGSTGLSPFANFLLYNQQKSYIIGIEVYFGTLLQDLNAI